MKRTLGYKRGVYTIIPEIIVVFAILLEVVKSNDQLHNSKEEHSFSFKRPGPVVFQTHGKIWPKPQLQTKGSQIFFTLNPANFSYKVCITIFVKIGLYLISAQWTLSIFIYDNEIIKINYRHNY
jgi:hypothetical protein